MRSQFFGKRKFVVVNLQLSMKRSRTPDGDSLGQESEVDNFQRAVKVSRPACSYNECNGKCPLLFEWPCGRRHIVCLHCLYLDIAEKTNWKEPTREGILPKPSQDIACNIDCPAGCQNSTIDFSEPGGFKKLHSLHPAVTPLHCVSPLQILSKRQCAALWVDKKEPLVCPACNEKAPDLAAFLAHPGQCNKVKTVPCPACHVFLEPGNDCKDHGSRCGAVKLHEVLSCVVVDHLFFNRPS